MKKPQPSTDLYVKSYSSADTPLNISADWSTRIEIYAFSPGALAWVSKEAPEFGTLHPQTKLSLGFVLWVLPVFDTQEVANYLQSYTDKESQVKEEGEQSNE